MGGWSSISAIYMRPWGTTPSHPRIISLCLQDLNQLPLHLGILQVTAPSLFLQEALRDCLSDAPPPAACCKVAGRPVGQHPLDGRALDPAKVLSPGSGSRSAHSHLLPSPPGPWPRGSGQTPGSGCRGSTCPASLLACQGSASPPGSGFQASKPEPAPAGRGREEMPAGTGSWFCSGENSAVPQGPEAWETEQWLAWGKGKETYTWMHLLCAGRWGRQSIRGKL